MSSFIKLEKIVKEGNTVTYDYSFSDDLAPYFNLDKKFQIDYNLESLDTNKSIEDVPDSIMVLPFLGNVLPISWLLDTDLIVPEIDESFYTNLSNVKQGFIDMYPSLEFNGRLIADKVIDNHTTESNRSLVFFSAGVDAWQTLCEHADEKPILLTMFGADFYLENTEGNEFCTKYMQTVAKEFGTELALFNTGLRAFINEKALNALFSKELGFHWWHRIQHGLGVIPHAAPIAWLKQVRTVYFASSYSFKDRERHKCASDPSIDNYIQFADATVVHDGYEYSRQDKIYNILQYSRLHKKPMFIHVCWRQDKEIENCCLCEKCQRTLFGILAEGYDPREFGFNCDLSTISLKVKHLLETNPLVLTKEMWEQIVYRFKMNPGIIQRFPEVSWVLDFDFNKKVPQHGHHPGHHPTKKHKKKRFSLRRWIKSKIKK